MSDFIEWLLALLLTLTTATAPADITEPEVGPDPTTSTTMSTQAYEQQATCGNGLYDTKFDPCPEQYNRTAQWLELVAYHFQGVTHQDMKIAMCVLYGESRGRPDVTNSIGARGLFQIMPNWADNEWAGTAGITYDMLLDPNYNVFAARKVFDLQGWGAWSAYSRGYVQDCISMNAFNAYPDAFVGWEAEGH